MRAFIIGSALVSLMLLSGCIKAASARSTKMFTFVYDKNLAHLKESIHLVRVGGGRKTIPFNKISRVSNRELQRAMIKSLEISNLLTEKNPKYKLSFHLLEEEALHFFGSTVVTTNMRYQLVDTFDDSIVYKKTFSVFHAVGVRRGFFYPDRHRKALEGSIKDNIEMFIKDLESTTFEDLP